MTNPERFKSWLKEKEVVGVKLPNEKGILPRAGAQCILPYVRAYWIGKHGERPTWKTETWVPSADNKKGHIRYLRADQVLGWLSSVWPLQGLGGEFRLELESILRTWLVPADEVLAKHPEIYDRRVETIRISPAFEGGPSQRAEVGDPFFELGGKPPKWEEDSSVFRWSRRPRDFPDFLRSGEDGLDVVHTPESERAGLTRYLCRGWEINDQGKLQKRQGGDLTWGPSTEIIPYKLHDGARRLMLGASLQSRAVPLRKTEIPLVKENLENRWDPPGRNLRVFYSSFEGWTHEDAFVICKTAAEKLTSNMTYQVRVLIPSVAPCISKVEPGPIKRGDVLARAWIDLYAIGWRQHEAAELLRSLGQLSEETATTTSWDGMLEVALTDAVAKEDGEVLSVDVESNYTARWRGAIVFRIRTNTPLRVGDKLATRHGVKGVVSRILDDEGMPPSVGGRAEIVMSPVGVMRRGAMGQFREGRPDATCDPQQEGTIFMIRQPQNAANACRVRGVGKSLVRGQRYGEMEFCALMAHGAENIAGELLSVRRSATAWMGQEEKLAPSKVRRNEPELSKFLASQALNRYFGLLGAQIKDQKVTAPGMEDRRIVVRPSKDAWKVHPSKIKTEGKELEEHLSDCEWFNTKRNGVFIVLPEPITLTIEGHRPPRPRSLRGESRQPSKIQVCFRAVPVLPPWLRPDHVHFSRRTRRKHRYKHFLTGGYKALLQSASLGAGLKWKRSWLMKGKSPEKTVAWRTELLKPKEILAECLRAAFDMDGGAGAFLRRQILGRRLTRSARAVIVPQPTLRIDQIAVPIQVYDTLFHGVGDCQRELVLVNRNPTLHRRGLLALRPVRDPNIQDVFGLPLGLLKVFGADFDGDQVSVIALETLDAITEARCLLPGSQDMRLDPLREASPAFPLIRELADTEGEYLLATDNTSSQEDWCVKQHEFLTKRITEVGDGWEEALRSMDTELWKGLQEGQWLERASEEMQTIYAVRQKGIKGGLLRRQLYQRPFKDRDSFWRSVEALEAITERWTQKALSVKGPKGGSPEIASSPANNSDSFEFDASDSGFFSDPNGYKAQLGDLSNEGEIPLGPDKICGVLNGSVKPTGLSAWVARPTLETLVDLLGGTVPNKSFGHDPRISWFLA